MAFRSTFVVAIAFTAVFTVASAARAERGGRSLLTGVRRIVFLGDSITYSGQYIDYLEAFLRTRMPDDHFELINLGLPSETVSGLTEPNHAGGAFPRPCLHERLDRALAKTHPDLVVACYGMNDGIYYPFSGERFQRYQDGIRRLVDAVHAAGAKLLLLTPPTFDPNPIRQSTLPAGREVYPSGNPFAGYDEVLQRYSRWLLDQRKHGWNVVDVHGPMLQHLQKHRLKTPDYHLADDGVHTNNVGHRLIAEAVLRAWGFSTAADTIPDQPILLTLIHQREHLLANAWLTAIGHSRPGMEQGEKLEDALRHAEELDAQIRSLTASNANPNVIKQDHPE